MDDVPYPFYTPTSFPTDLSSSHVVDILEYDISTYTGAAMVRRLGEYRAWLDERKVTTTHLSLDIDREFWNPRPLVAALQRLFPQLRTLVLGINFGPGFDALLPMISALQLDKLVVSDLNTHPLWSDFSIPRLLEAMPRKTRAQRSVEDVLGSRLGPDSGRDVAGIVAAYVEDGVEYHLGRYGFDDDDDDVDGILAGLVGARATQKGQRVVVLHRVPKDD